MKLRRRVDPVKTFGSGQVSTAIGLLGEAQRVARNMDGFIG